ncbi:MAG TPA: M15 family metallopeptidase [Nocardioidaceae bacterium]|nr:M15 family metallopeptidase [Nocardioidaceae bacterium]
MEVFKRWGFAWGGDWSYTDPMHFELAALVEPR